MKLKILFVVLFLLFLTPNYAQESIIKVDEAMSQLLTLIEKKDIKAMLSISSQKIYCLLCFEKPKNKKDPYLIKKKRFYKRYFNTVFDDELIKRINRNEKTIISEKSSYYDYIVLFSIYRKDELALGHEGVQFGFWFKNENGNLKLTGIETIP